MQKNYLVRQEEHHGRMTTQGEFRQFLRLHDLEWARSIYGIKYCRRVAADSRMKLIFQGLAPLAIDNRRFAAKTA